MQTSVKQLSTPVLRARQLFRKEISFLGSAYLRKDQQGTDHLALPTEVCDTGSFECPEIAFAGQSNVGKSSLIKALFMNPDLPVKKMQQLMKSDCLPSNALSYLSEPSPNARITNAGNREVLPSPVKTSKRPGHTRSLNFFSVGLDQFRLVDMPGYGFNSRQEWGQMSVQYFDQRRQLKRVFLLRDIRKQFDQLDVEVIRILDECRVPFQLVLTKCDMFPPELQSFKRKVVDDAREFCATRTSCFIDSEVLCVAALNGSGVDELKLQVLDLVSKAAGPSKKPL